MGFVLEQPAFFSAGPTLMRSGVGSPRRVLFRPGASRPRFI